MAPPRTHFSNLQIQLTAHCTPSSLTIFLSCGPLQQRKAFLASPMVQLLMKSEEITAREAEAARLANANPLHNEDAAMWKNLPLVPRKAVGGWGEGVVDTACTLL